MSHQKACFSIGEPEVGQTLESVIGLQVTKCCTKSYLSGAKGSTRYRCKCQQCQQKRRRRKKKRNFKYHPMAMVICCSIMLQAIVGPMSSIGIYPASAGLVVGGRRAQDVALDEELEAGAAGSSGSRETASSENSEFGESSIHQQGQGQEQDGSGVKNLDAFLEALPVLSVGQKHSARFECELNREANGMGERGGGSTQTQPYPSVKLVWVKLIRGQESSRAQPSKLRKGGGGKAGQAGRDDIKLISLDQKLITPDRRFKVHRQATSKWALTIDNVQQDDGNAYYLCQASATEAPRQQQQQPPPLAAVNSLAGGCSSSTGQLQPASELDAGRYTGNYSSRAGCHETTMGGMQGGSPEAAQVGRRGRLAASTSNFVGGARLNVLAPPRIVEHETSASFVVANEHESLHLKCKVSGEPQSQLMWKREDNRAIDSYAGVEQRFRHESQRKPNHQILSIDSSELVFEPFLRSQAGAYLCIASNGIQPGVSQRINVMAANCRANKPASGGGGVNVSEACDKPAELFGPADGVTSTTTGATTGAADSTRQQNSTRKAWRTASSQRQESPSPSSSSSSQYPSKYMKNNRPLATDKRRAPANGLRNATTSSSEQLTTTTNGMGQVSIKQTDSASASSSSSSSSSIANNGLNSHTGPQDSGLISWRWLLLLFACCSHYSCYVVHFY